MVIGVMNLAWAVTALVTPLLAGLAEGSSDVRLAFAATGAVAAAVLPRRARSSRPRPDGGYTSDPLGPLAQLVEQGTLNPKVEGSNPSRPIAKTLLTRGFFSLRGMARRGGGNEWGNRPGP